jgi:hypothetical protein
MPARDPEHASAIGTVRALKRHRPAGDPAIVDATRDLHAAQLAAHIRRVVDSAPPLTEAQRDRLAVLLRSGGNAA